MQWFMWAILLLLQNASFTWVSRARNSASVGYHALAAVFSNGIFFANFFLGVDKVKEASKSGDARLIGATIAFYTVFTVIGSVSMHILLKRVEKGNQKVGA